MADHGYCLPRKRGADARDRAVDRSDLLLTVEESRPARTEDEHTRQRIQDANVMTHSAGGFVKSPSRVEKAPTGKDEQAHQLSFVGYRLAMRSVSSSRSSALTRPASRRCSA